MDNQKQIEEMAKIIDTNCVGCSTCKYKSSDEIRCFCLFHAELLYNAGYRKIPENAVVILDEEMEEFAEKLAKSPQMQKVMSHLIKEWRKETAEKFAERLKKDCVWRNDFDSEGVAHPYTILELEELDEICKEITEG